MMRTMRTRCRERKLVLDRLLHRRLLRRPSFANFVADFGPRDAFFGGRGVRFLRGARRFFRGARGGGVRAFWAPLCTQWDFYLLFTGVAFFSLFLLWVLTSRTPSGSWLMLMHSLSLLDIQHSARRPEPRVREATRKVATSGLITPPAPMRVGRTCQAECLDHCPSIATLQSPPFNRWGNPSPPSTSTRTRRRPSSRYSRPACPTCGRTSTRSASPSST